MIAAIISEAPTPLATSMDITPSGQSPPAPQAQPGLLAPPAGVALAPWTGAIEALVVAALAAFAAP